VIIKNGSITKINPIPDESKIKLKKIIYPLIFSKKA
jgi:hypothetical protein